MNIEKWHRKCEIEFQLQSMERAKELIKRIDHKLMADVEKARKRLLEEELEKINSEQTTTSLTS